MEYKIYKSACVNIEIKKAKRCNYSDEKVISVLKEYFSMLIPAENFYVSEFFSVFSIQGIIITSGNFICQPDEILNLGSIKITQGYN